MQTRCKLERPSETYSKRDRKPDMKENKRTQDSGNDDRGGDEKGACSEEKRDTWRNIGRGYEVREPKPKSG